MVCLICLHLACERMFAPALWLISAVWMSANTSDKLPLPMHATYVTREACHYILTGYIEYIYSPYAKYESNGPYIHCYARSVNSQLTLLMASS